MSIWVVFVATHILFKLQIIVFKIMTHENQKQIKIEEILPKFLASPMEEIKITTTKRPWMSKASLENIFLKQNKIIMN